ncbi:hypothetical protein J6590_040773 [Homalodisca vitripennis]|nr:hypothetical protein J6590_040773 [Homalodisca vitripennis]
MFQEELDQRVPGETAETHVEAIAKRELHSEMFQEELDQRVPGETAEHMSKRSQSDNYILRCSRKSWTSECREKQQNTSIAKRELHSEMFQEELDQRVPGETAEHMSKRSQSDIDLSETVGRSEAMGDAVVSSGLTFYL